VRQHNRLILTVLLFIFIIQEGHPSYAQDALKSIQAPSAIIIDANTGDVLWSKKANSKRSIASITKVITAIVAIEKGNLEQTVTVGKDINTKDLKGIGLIPGERIKLNDLLYALMLYSANDSAAVIAEHISGSVNEFVRLMNIKAAKIGALNTKFSNPHGLDNEPLYKGNYSTAYDLATIARYALKNKTFQRIISCKEKLLNRGIKGKQEKIINRNKLLWTYEGATGIKTGHTNAAGYCLLSSAKRDDVQLISVVLGAKSYNDLFSQSSALLNYGFSLYEKKKLISKGKLYRSVKMRYGQKVDLVALIDAEASIRKTAKTSIKLDFKPRIQPPIKKGTKLGTISVVQDGRIIASSPLITRQSVKSPTIKQKLMYYMNRYWENIEAFFAPNTSILTP